MNKLSIESNFNNKLSCGSFMHVDTAPNAGVPESKMNQLYTMITRDGSHPPVTVRLFSITRMKMEQLRDCFTVPSHGMEAAEFATWFMQKHPEAGWDYPLAVYYYRIE